MQGMGCESREEVLPSIQHGRKWFDMMDYDLSITLILDTVDE